MLWLVENGDMSRTTEGMYVVAHSQGKKKKGKSGAGSTAIVAAELDGAGDAQGGAGDSGKEASFAARVNGRSARMPLPPSLLRNPKAGSWSLSFPFLSFPFPLHPNSRNCIRF